MRRKGFEHGREARTLSSSNIQDQTPSKHHSGRLFRGHRRFLYFQGFCLGKAAANTRSHRSRKKGQRKCTYSWSERTAFICPMCVCFPETMQTGTDVSDAPGTWWEGRSKRGNRIQLCLFLAAHPGNRCFALGVCALQSPPGSSNVTAKAWVREGSRKHAGIKRKCSFALHVEWKKKISHILRTKKTQRLQHTKRRNGWRDDAELRSSESGVKAVKTKRAEEIRTKHPTIKLINLSQRRKKLKRR